MKYTKIIKKAKKCRKNVKKEYRLGLSTKWSYYFAKAILTKKDVPDLKFTKANNPTGDHISRQISKKEYIILAENLVNFVEKNHQLPNYITLDSKKIKPKLYTYLLARILYYNYKKNKQAKKVKINSKVFKKPTETTNEVYNYFVDVFGEFGNTIDGALQKINGKGYGYYYDDIYSNKESIQRMKQGKGVNCTDSCQVFYNIMLQLIALGKYSKVECLHVMCSSGGHVKLRITLNDGTKIIRDPACALSDNGKGYTCNWCTNTPIAIDPSWFMENLNR